MKLDAAALALRYGRPQLVREFVHGRRTRAKHAAHIARGIQRSSAKRVLHFAGTRYLPLPEYALVGSRHYLYIDSALNYWEDSRLPRSYNEAFEEDMRRAYHQMTHIFSACEHARDALVEHYNVPSERISVVGTGRGIIAPYHGAKDYRNGVVLFVAKGDAYRKGGDLLLEAFQLARRQLPHIELRMVTDAALGRKASGQPGVRVYGFLALEELQRLFEEASLFAMPARLEPWGLVYLEAMSCKTPVLGLRRGALPEITRGGEGGFMAEHATPESVASELVRALSDAKRLEQIGLSEQQRILERFTWQQVVNRIVERLDSN